MRLISVKWSKNNFFKNVLPKNLEIFFFIILGGFADNRRRAVSVVKPNTRGWAHHKPVGVI